MPVSTRRLTTAVVIPDRVGVFVYESVDSDGFIHASSEPDGFVIFRGRGRMVSVRFRGWILTAPIMR